MNKHRSILTFAAAMMAGSLIFLLPFRVHAQGPPDQELEPQPLTEEYRPSVEDHRGSLSNTDYICEVVFLGYIGEYSGKLADNREFLQQFLEESGYLPSYPFVQNLPNEQIIEIEGGHELYCIFPVDPDASVAVNEYLVNESNDFCGETGDILYKSETGVPILLRCNVSDIIRDSEVNIVDSQGRIFSWQFGISLYDGSVLCPDFAPYAFDASYLNAVDDSYDTEDNWTDDCNTESEFSLDDVVYDINNDSMFTETWVSYEELQNYGTKVFEFEKDGYQIIGFRDKTCEESLSVCCYKDKERIWGYMTNVFFLSELDETEVFLAGLDVTPKIVIFNSYMGMYMIDPFTGVIDWKIEEPDLPLTGSLSYMIDGFGNMFLKGKYDVDVIKITMDGRVVN